MTTFQKDKCLYNKKIEFLCYFFFYIAVTSIFSFINIPILTMIINLIGFLGLSFLYNKNLPLNLQISIVIYSIILIEDLFFIYITNYSNKNIFIPNEHKSIFIIFLYDVTLLLSAIFLKYFIKKKQNRRNISTAPILNMFVSLVTVVIALTLVTEINISGKKITLIVILLLFINLISIFGYEQMISIFNKSLEIERLREKTRYYEKELKLMNETVKTARKYKHDEKNHILALQGLIEEQSYDKTKKYLDNMLQTYIDNDNMVKSKNKVINSLLNYKIKKMIENHIEVQTCINIKENLPISDYDISIILGNILDNAIDAVMKISEEKRLINIEILDEKNKFTIKVKNTYNGKINYKAGRLMTTKTNGEKHGIGIESIKETIKNYDGLFKVAYDDKEFVSYVLILHN